MPFDDRHMRGPESRNELWIAVGVLSLILGLFAAEVVTNYHPGKLVGLLFLIVWMPLIALHEAGHAVAAWLVGWRVRHVVVGFGKTLWRTRIGTATVELRMLPIEGFAASVPGDLRFPQLKHAFVYFAGPGVELLLAAVLIVVVGVDEFFTASGDAWIILAQAVGVAALVGGVLNLIPHGAAMNGRIIPNDGLGILLSMIRPTSYYRELYGLRYDVDEEAWTDDGWRGGR